MKFEAINKKFTEAVTRWIAKGYHFNLSTMTGFQTNEVAHADLTNGVEVIRIVVADGYEIVDGDHVDIYRIIVGKATVCVYPDTTGCSDTIWNHRLEVLEEEKLYCVSTRGGGWFVTEGEYKEMYEIRKQRRKIHRTTNRPIEFDSAAAKKLALAVLRRHPKCKSKKMSDITRVTKTLHHNHFGTHKEWVLYSVFYKAGEVENRIYFSTINSRLHVGY